MGTTFSLLPIAYRLLPYTLRLVPLIAPLNFLFSLMISGGLSRPGGERLPGPDGRVNLSLFHHPPVRAPLIKVNSSTY